MSELPDKPSDLIDMSLEDLTEVERDPDYQVCMDHWHVARSPRRLPCLVCLAGAVIARRLDVSPDIYCNPAFFGAATRNKLYALDCFRRGDVAQGLLYALDMKEAEFDALGLPFQIDFPMYSQSPEGFREGLRCIRDSLRMVNL